MIGYSVDTFKLKKQIIKFIAIILAFFYGSLLTGCQKSKNDKIIFVTSCYPVNIIALNLTENVDGTEVINMSENQQVLKENNLINKIFYVKVNIFSKIVTFLTKKLPFKTRFRYSLASRSISKLVIVKVA